MHQVILAQIWRAGGGTSLQLENRVPPGVGALPKALVTPPGEGFLSWGIHPSLESLRQGFECAMDSHQHRSLGCFLFQHPVTIRKQY